MMNFSYGRVELLEAFCWVCDDCCEENYFCVFARPYSEKSEEQEAAEEMGFEFAYYDLPKILKCKCGASYELQYDEADSE